MLKAYYAHPVSLYNTKAEQRDLDTIKALGFDVLNPNSKDIEAGYLAAKAATTDGNAMSFFTQMVQSCDLLIFRSFDDGSISAGVVSEIKDARAAGKPVIELPSNIVRRALSPEATKEMLIHAGAR